MLNTLQRIFIILHYMWTGFMQWLRKNHKGNHEIIKYDSITPKVKIIRNELEKIKEKTAQARNDIIQLKNMIEEAVDVLDDYYNIAMDLIEKYETYNTQLRNFHVISNINSLAESNKKVFEDLDQILIGDRSKEDYLNRCEALIDIYISNKKKLFRWWCYWKQRIS